VKNQLPLQFVKSVWLKCLILHLCPQVVFPFIEHFFHNILFKLVDKKKTSICFIKIGTLYICNKFDLWMSKGAHDIFAFD
jgi:hypothetical protein